MSWISFLNITSFIALGSDCSFSLYIYLVESSYLHVNFWLQFSTSLMVPVQFVRSFWIVFDITVDSLRSVCLPEPISSCFPDEIAYTELPCNLFHDFIILNRRSACNLMHKLISISKNYIICTLNNQMILFQLSI